MSPVLMAVIGELGFLALAILQKRLRNRGAQTKAILASYGLTLPVWIAIIPGFLIFAGQSIEVTQVYLLIVAAWLCACFFLNFGAVYLMRYQSMSDGTGYRFGFTVLLALLADVFIFSTGLSYEKLVTLCMLFAGGTILHFSRQQHINADMTMPLAKRLAAIFVIALAEVATYSLFKYGAALQPSSILHNAVLSILLFTTFLLLGGREMVRENKDGKLPSLYLVALVVILVPACLADGLAMAALPVSVFVMFSLIRAVAYAVHDIKTKELLLTPANGLAIALIIGGLVYTAYLNHNV